MPDGRHIVVTGGSGELGQAVVAELLGAGYQVLSLDRRPHPSGHKRSWVVDLLDSGALFEATQGAYAVVHLAAHIAPDLASDTKTFNDNVAMTYNVLRASSGNGVKKVVLASSTAVYGFLYGNRGKTPPYLPADEAHPLLAHDPYGLSKIVGERMGEAFATAHDMVITSLRMPGVNYDPRFERVKRLLVDPGFRAPGFWSYVDARDAAAAVRLALDRSQPGHRAYNIACNTSNMAEPTAELVARYFPELHDVRCDAPGNWSGIDCSAAASELGFTARHTWQDAPAA